MAAVVVDSEEVEAASEVAFVAVGDFVAVGVTEAVAEDSEEGEVASGEEAAEDTPLRTTRKHKDSISI